MNSDIKTILLTKEQLSQRVKELAKKAGYCGRNMFFSNDELLSRLAQRLDTKKLLRAFDLVSSAIKNVAKMNPTASVSSINAAFSDDM